MRRMALMVLALVLFSLAVSACSTTQSTTQTGTFTGWVTKPIENPSSPAEKIFGQRTDMAFVTLADGTRVKANCPIQSLQNGDKVAVKQNDDGTWVVMGKQ